MLVALALVVGVVVVGPPAEAVVVAASKTYTTTADFDQGLKASVSSANDQLELTKGGTFPFIWIALSQRCTIAKVSTETGAILGEYRTKPQNVGCGESSRTTVALNGSVWVGHRALSRVTHVGAREANQCVDRNNNGTIETSTGYDDVLPWPGSAADASEAADECILHHVDTDGGDSRHLSINTAGNVVVGSFSGGRFFTEINNNTGAVVSGPHTGFTCGGYGGLVDKNNVLWSANGGSTGMLRWDMNAPMGPNNPRCINVTTYGMGLDPFGNVWTGEYGDNIFKVSPDGNTILGPFNHGQGGAQGLAVDPNGDVWVSSSFSCSTNCTIAHFSNDGTLIGKVQHPDIGGPIGVAVDAAGKIWTANYYGSNPSGPNGNATRIDPNAGPTGAGGKPIGAVDLTVPFPSTNNGAAFPYNYSDMTGALALGNTAPQGSWTIVQDSGADGTRWGTVSWNATLPPGTSLDTSFEVRASDTEAGLGNEDFEGVQRCSPIAAGATGRFIEVRLTLRANQAGDSPIVHDVTVKSEEAAQQEGCEGQTVPTGGGGEQVLGTQTARARDFTSACPPTLVPPLTFLDVSSTNIHRPAIACIAWWQVTIGKTVELVLRPAEVRAAAQVVGYAPAQSITRGQLASMLARLIRRTGGTLPANAPDAFSDDGSSVHQANINALAAAGIVEGFGDGTFRPDTPVRRDQMATFVHRAYQHRAGRALPIEGDFFTDDNGNTHEGAINALAGAGIVEGVGNRLYDPSAELRRDQMASFLVRLLDLLVDEGKSGAPPGA